MGGQLIVFQSSRVWKLCKEQLNEYREGAIRRAGEDFLGRAALLECSS
jgi:hypothetical protein